MPPINPLLLAVDMPPIPAAQAWGSAYDGRHGPLINMAQAVPGTPPPEAFLDRLAAEAAKPAAATYGAILGDDALRRALAADVHAVYGGDATADDVAITTGCNQAFFVAMVTLARAGDEILLPAPWYFNHKMTLDMLGIVARPLPCRPENAFVPQPEDARPLIGPATRAIVLVTPNNPTGATYPAAVVEVFRELAAERRIALVIDETYRDFLPAGQELPHTMFRRGDWRESVMQLYSFSKSYAVPGHRLGAILAGPDTLQQVAKVLDTIQICPPRAAQAAVAWAVEATATWRREVRDAINGRIAVFRDVVARSAPWSLSAIGAYFAYVRHPFRESGEAVAERLAREAGVLALPGAFFGPGQDDHLRFAFANVDGERLAAVAERLALFR